VNEEDATGVLGLTHIQLLRKRPPRNAKLDFVKRLATRSGRPCRRRMRKKLGLPAKR
jgi:hypothetical protein